jgi:hypothetical protein
VLLRGALVDLGLGEPVQAVVAERLGEALIGVGAAEHVAEHVVGIGEALHRAAAAGEDRGQPVGQRIEALGGDDAVAGGLLGEPQLGVARVRGPVDLGSRTGHLLDVTEARIAVAGDEAGGVGDADEATVGVIAGGEGVIGEIVFWECSLSSGCCRRLSRCWRDAVSQGINGVHADSSISRPTGNIHERSPLCTTAGSGYPLLGTSPCTIRDDKSVLFERLSVRLKTCGVVGIICVSKEAV